MKAWQIVVAVLFVAFGSGCGTNPNRPYPPQQEVSADIIGHLITKKIEDTPIYVSSRVYHHDLSNALQVEKNVLKKEGRKVTLGDLPIVLNAPAVERTYSTRLFKAFKKHLLESGFRLTDDPLCNSCLVVIIDYGQRRFEEISRNLFITRARVYFSGKEIVAARDDWAVWWKDSRTDGPSDDLLVSAAEMMTTEMRQVWNWRIASLKKTLSKKTTAPIQGIVQ